MKTILKVVVFAALMCAYFLLAGTPGWNTLYGRKLAVIFAFAAVIALWCGRRSIGTLHPITLRPIFIAFGSLLMLGIFILVLTTKDVANHLGQSNTRPIQQPGTVTTSPPELLTIALPTVVSQTVASTSLLPPGRTYFDMLNLPDAPIITIGFTQEIYHIHDNRVRPGPQGTLQIPSSRNMPPGYFDLIETHAIPPTVDFSGVK